MVFRCLFFFLGLVMVFRCSGSGWLISCLILFVVFGVVRVRLVW